MAMFDFTVIGDRQVSLKFEEFPRKAHDALLGRITSLADRLAEMVRAAAPEKTGRLRSEIVERINDRGEKITGSVSVSAEFAKAAALEYGAHKATRVKAHQMSLDHVFANRLAQPLTVMVSEYSRQPNIAERRFLRGPLEAIEAQAIDELRQAVEDAARE